MSRDTLKMLHDAKKNEEPTVDGWPLYSGLPDPIQHLWECIGRWSAMLVHDGEHADLSPPTWLRDAVKAATTQHSCKTCKRCQTEAF